MQIISDDSWYLYECLIPVKKIEQVSSALDKILAVYTFPFNKMAQVKDQVYIRVEVTLSTVSNISQVVKNELL